MDGRACCPEPYFSLLCFLPKFKVTLCKHGELSPVPPQRKNRNKMLTSPLREKWRFENPTAHFNWFSNFPSSSHYHLKLLGLQVKSSCWCFRVTRVCFLLSETLPCPGGCPFHSLILDSKYNHQGHCLHGLFNPFSVLSDLKPLTEQSSLDSSSLLSCSTCSKCLLRSSIDFTPFVPPSLLKTKLIFPLSSYESHLCYCLHHVLSHLDSY